MTLRFRTLTFLLFLITLSGFLFVFSLNAYYTTAQILKDAAQDSLKRSGEAIQHELDIQLRLIDQDLNALALDPKLQEGISHVQKAQVYNWVFGDESGEQQRFSFVVIRSYEYENCWLLKNPLLNMGPTNCQKIYERYNQAKRNEWTLLQNGAEWLLVKDFLVTNEEQKVIGRLIGGIKISNNTLFLTQLVRRTQSDLDFARLIADGVSLSSFENTTSDKIYDSLSFFGLDRVLEEQLEFEVVGFDGHLTLRLQSAENRVHSLARQLFFLLLGGGLAGLVISALVAALLSAALDRQLQKLVNYMRIMTSGSVATGWMPGRIKEFNRMGVQVDGVFDELSTQRHKLNKANQRLKKALSDKRTILHQLINSQEQERNHLAQELHDELGQLLTAVRVETTLLEHQISMSSPALKNTSNIKELVAAMYATVYDRIMALRPTELDHLGLCQSIQQIPTLNSLRQSGVKIELDLEEVDTPAGADIHLYRIVQEALTNVLKHAFATELSISLMQTENEILLCIKDNGQGFVPDLEVDPKGHRGFGILGIEERCDYIGAILTLESSLGVTMTVSLPLA